MHRIVIVPTLVVLACAGLVVALSPRSVAQQPMAMSVERGRYLVEDAGKCSDCHGEKLQGMALDFLNPNLPPVVQRNTPRIAGLPMFSDDTAAVNFLQTGELPDKSRARPPMPQYRFNHDDASAIVAYLRSLR